MKIAFFGTAKNAALVLNKLISSEFRPTLAVTGADVKRGRGRKLQSTPVKRAAETNNIQVLSPENLKDKKFIAIFREFLPDVAILTAYGKIIPEEILAIPKYGFVNIHPSLLPKYRGPSPIYQAILEGDKKTGLTIIRLDKDLDHGPIIAKKNLNLTRKDTHDSLTTRLTQVGADLLISILPSYLDGSLKPVAQDSPKATYTKMIKKEDGFIDLENPPDPEKLNRMIRAYYSWPTVWSKVKVKSGKSIIIKLLPSSLKAQKPNSPFLIQPEGRQAMTIAEFKNGYPKAFEKLNRLFEKD